MIIYVLKANIRNIMLYRTTKPYRLISARLLKIHTSSSVNPLKKFFLNDSQRQTFAMSVLRLYNITKVSFDGKTINTPKMRSAETFNAMCKALEEKTDDQWSYGEENMEKSEIEDIVEIFLKTKP